MIVKFARNLLNGLAFGITEIVPGVSGSTIAVLLGFYDEAIYTINHFNKNYRRSFLFAVPILIGAAVGVLALASVMDYLLTNHTFPTMLFFIGIIVGIIPRIFAKVKTQKRRISLKTLLLIALPFGLLILLSLLRTSDSPQPAEMLSNIGPAYMVFIFVAGIVAACALVVPGISGSMILLLLGMYHLIMYSVSSLLSSFSEPGLFLSICKVLVPLGLGIVIGGLVMARLIEWLLKKHYHAAFAIILGLLLASVFVLFSDSAMYKNISVIAVVCGVITLILGFLASFALGKKTI